MNEPTLNVPWFREPLLHFVLLGAVVFAADAVISSRQSNPKVITIGPEVIQEINTVYRNATGRDPSAADLKVLRERWLDNEVLYREGLALRVDQGDSSIRDRVIFKALNVMQANINLPPADEKSLRSYFDKNRLQYDEPARIDFLEAVLVGDKSPAAAQAFVAALNAGSSGDKQSGLRVFKGRPRNTLVQSYGEEFSAALERLPVGVWHVLSSKDGVHVVQLQATQAGALTPYETVKARVLQDWRDDTMQALRTNVVRELGKKYAVHMIDTATPAKASSPPASSAAAVAKAS